jgi:hypothetical protein
MIISQEEEEEIIIVTEEIIDIEKNIIKEREKEAIVDQTPETMMMTMITRKVGIDAKENTMIRAIIIRRRKAEEGIEIVGVGQKAGIEKRLIVGLSLEDLIKRKEDQVDLTLVTKIERDILNMIEDQIKNTMIKRRKNRNLRNQNKKE